MAMVTVLQLNCFLLLSEMGHSSLCYTRHVEVSEKKGQRCYSLSSGKQNEQERATETAKIGCRQYEKRVLFVYSISPILFARGREQTIERREK